MKADNMKKEDWRSFSSVFFCKDINRDAQNVSLYFFMKIDFRAFLKKYLSMRYKCVILN